MRVQKMILLMWAGLPLSAGACQCRASAPQYFLNTIAQGSAPPYVAIPQNAKGILFFSDEYEHDVLEIDVGKLLLTIVPPAITAARFSIVETETGRSVEPVVTRLNVDGQIGRGKDQRYYRARFMGIFHQDVTADVKEAYGLFRVGPAGGFRSGHRYQFTYRPRGDAQQSLQAEVRVGPAITLPFADDYGLRLEGRLTPKMISLPEDARCGEKTASLVQELTYTLPPSLAPFRNGVLFFTQKRARFDEDGKELAFTNRRYDSSQCTLTPPGHGELGALKDLAVARCNRYGLKWEDTLVKGYVGMLEIEDTLHETATYTIPLERSAKALCAILGAVNGS